VRLSQKIEILKIMPIKKVKFEDSIDLINLEISKRRNKWNLSAINWMDFNDVSQILRIHIYKKWHMYNSSKRLAPWINRIISNQIRNLIRNHYSNFARPCLKCSAAQDEDGCLIYEKQCSACPLYNKWLKNKKNAFDTKLTLSMENHSNEISQLPITSSVNLDESAKNIHQKMEAVLKGSEWRLYKCLYIDNRSEDEAAKVLGYKTTERNRSAGYKQIKNLKKSILIKVKKYLYNGEIDIS